MAYRTKLAGLLLIPVVIWLAILSMGQTSSILESSGQGCYLLTNDTSTSFPATTASRSTTKPTNFFGLGPDASAGRRYRGAEITLFGSGSATQTFAWKLWVVKRGFSTTGSVQDYEWQLYCSGTATLGTTAGVLTTAGSGVRTTDLIADSITLDADEAYMTKTAAAYGGVEPLVFAPGSNGIARLYIPDFGNAAGFFIEYDMTGATSGNALIERVN